MTALLGACAPGWDCWLMYAVYGVTFVAPFVTVVYLAFEK